MISPVVAPATYQVVALFYFVQKAWNLFGVMLQVAVHGDDDLAPGKIKTCFQRRRLPKIPPQPHQVYAPVVLINFREHLERSEEHTSELQSLRHLVCRLLLEKKKKNNEPVA